MEYSFAVNINSGTYTFTFQSGLHWKFKRPLMENIMFSLFIICMFNIVTPCHTICICNRNHTERLNNLIGSRNIYFHNLLYECLNVRTPILRDLDGICDGVCIRKPGRIKIIETALAAQRVIVVSCALHRRKRDLSLASLTRTCATMHLPVNKFAPRWPHTDDAY